MKSTQTLHLPFFFFTTTVLANHSGKTTSLMALALFNFSTSSFTASTWGFATLLGLYFFVKIEGSTFNWCLIKAGSTSSTSYGFQVNTSKFCTNDNKISTRSFTDKFFLIQKYLSKCGSILIWTNFSALFTPVELSDIGNCYNDSQSTHSACFSL